jgi:hypothetical protein
MILKIYRDYLMCIKPSNTIPAINSKSAGTCDGKWSYILPAVDRNATFLIDFKEDYNAFTKIVICNTLTEFGTFMEPINYTKVNGE